jgi:heme/copper-type cytochrome/quinol oxidase subunit 4
MLLLLVPVVLQFFYFVHMEMQSNAVSLVIAMVPKAVLLIVPNSLVQISFTGILDIALVLERRSEMYEDYKICTCM